MATAKVKIVKVYINSIMYEYEFDARGLKYLPEEEVIRMANNNEFKLCFAYPLEEKSSKLIHEYVSQINESENQGNSDFELF